MSDDVEIGVDGSGAETGVKKIVQTLERIASASERVASDSSKAFDSMYAKLNKLGDSGVASKYERMASAMERATDKTSTSIGTLNSLINQTSRGGAGLAKLADNLGRLASYKGPNASAVSNTERLMTAVAGVKVSSSLNNLSALTSLTSYKGPSSSSVANTTSLVQALSQVKISSSIGRLGVLADLSGFKGPSAKSVQNTTDLIQALSKIRFADASGVTSVLSQLNGAGARLGSTGTAARTAGDQVNRLGAQSKTAAGGLGALGASADKLNQSLYHTERFFGTIANVAGLSFVAGEIQKFDAASASLQAVNKNIAATTTEMSYLTEISQKYGIYLGNLTQGWSQFRNAASNANLTLESTKSLFEGITQSSRVFNLSFSDQEGVFRAVTQIMSKGSLQMEELRGQLGERLPIAIQAMANALGVSVSKLGEMTKKAQVVGPVLQKALAGFGPELQRMTAGGLASSLNTIGASMSNLRTEGMLLSKAMGDAGLTAAMMNVLHAATGLISEGGGLRDLLLNAASAANLLSQNLGTVATVAGILLVGKLGLIEKATAAVIAANIAATSTMSQLAIASSGASKTALDLAANLGYVARMDQEVIGSEAALTQVTLRGIAAKEGSIAASRLLAVSLGTVSAANIAATESTIGLTAASIAYGQAQVGVAATSLGTSTALMRVTAGATTGVTAMGLLRTGAMGAKTAMSSLLAAVGLTSPWLIGAAAAVGVFVALTQLSDAAKDARKATDELKSATNLASDAMLGASTNIDIAAASYRSMTQDVRDQTTALLQNNRAMLAQKSGEAQTRLEKLRDNTDFQALGKPAETALNLGLGVGGSDPTTRIQGLQTLEGMLKSQKDKVKWYQQGSFARNSELSGAISSTQSMAAGISGDIQSSALLEMRKLADAGLPVTLENIGKGLGYTVEQLKAVGVNAPDSVKGVEAIGNAGKKSRERLVPLTTTLEELVRLTPAIKDAQSLLNAGSGADSSGGGGQGATFTKAAQDRLEAVNSEREALGLSADAWTRYQKSIGKKDSDKGITFEEARLKKSAAATRIYTEALHSLADVWEAEVFKTDLGPVGADRMKAIQEATRSYRGLGSVFQQLKIQMDLINSDNGGLDALTDDERPKAMESATRKALLTFQSQLGVQGDILSEMDKQIDAQQTLNALAAKFPGLDVSEAMAQNSRNSALAIKNLYANSSAGKGSSVLADGLADQAKTAAERADSVFQTQVYRQNYLDKIQRPALTEQYGAAGADGIIASQEKLNASNQAMELYLSKVQAVGSAFDTTAQALNEFLQTGTLNVREFALNVITELTNAFAIQPILNNAKTAFGNWFATTTMGQNIMGTAGSAASAASTVAQGASQAAAQGAQMVAALTPAVTGLTTAAGTLTGASTALTGSSTALIGSGTALTGSATALGASATGLGGAAAAMGTSAGALGIAAAALTTAGAALTAAAAAKAGSSVIKTVATVAKVAAMVAHTGGVIGQSNLASRTVSPGSFLGATRYHTGGLAGRKPFRVGEVPAILKKKEEVLTENDPRHINNIGSQLPARDMQYAGGSSQTTNINNKITLVVQAPTPSGNATADANAQQATAAKAAEAMEAVLQNHSDRGARTRNMSVK